MPHFGRVAGDGILGLLLGADEQDRAAVGDEVADERVGGLDPRQRLVQIDDVDAVALTEDESLHLRVPAPGLVAEVDAGLQQLLHRDDSHGVLLPIGWSATRAPAPSFDGDRGYARAWIQPSADRWDGAEIVVGAGGLDFRPGSDRRPLVAPSRVATKTRRAAAATPLTRPPSAVRRACHPCLAAGHQQAPVVERAGRPAIRPRTPARPARRRRARGGPPASTRYGVDDH